MSDPLSGLHKDIASGNWATNDLPSALAYNQALGDVAEALRYPTDEQVAEVADFWHTYHYSIFDTITGQLVCVCGDAGDRDLHRIRVVLVAAAGVDDE